MSLTTTEAAPVRVLTRMTALSDAVFAFAATLLAARLVLDAPEGTGVLDAVGARVPALILYVVAFLSIAYLWWRHHRLLRLLDEVDDSVQVWNLLVLAFVAVMPYPTQLLGESQVPLAVAMFAAPLVGASLAMVVMVRRARRRGLLREGVTTTTVDAVTGRLTVLPAVLVSSFLLVPLGAWWAMAAWAAVVPASILVGRRWPDSTEVPPPSEVTTDDGMERLLGFSDAVYAVVITLLADQLDAGADPGRDLTQAELWDQVSASSTTFLAFLLTFYTAGLFWTIHVRTFRWAVRLDTVVLWTALVHLMLLTLQPFALSLFADYGFSSDRGATVIYVGALLATEISIVCVVLALQRRRGLMVATTEGQRRAVRARSIFATGLFVVALALAAALPEGQTAWAFAVFVGFNLLDPLARYLDPTGESTSRGRRSDPATPR